MWFPVALEILIRIHRLFSGLKGEAPFTTSDLSEEYMFDSNYVDDLSSEGLVLQDLQIASGKVRSFSNLDLLFALSFQIK